MKGGYKLKGGFKPKGGFNLSGGFKLKGGLNLSGGINLILPQLTVDLEHFKPHYQSKHSEIGYDGDDREHIDEHSKDPHHCSLVTRCCSLIVSVTILAPSYLIKTLSNNFEK